MPAFETEQDAHTWLKQFVEAEILGVADISTFISVLDDLNKDHFTNEKVDMDPPFRADAYFQHQSRIDFFKNLQQWQQAGGKSIDKLDSIVWDWLSCTFLENECAYLKAMFYAHYTHPIHEEVINVYDREKIILIYDAMVDTIVPRLIAWQNTNLKINTRKEVSHAS